MAAPLRRLNQQTRLQPAWLLSFSSFSNSPVNLDEVAHCQVTLCTSEIANAAADLTKVVFAAISMRPRTPIQIVPSTDETPRSHEGFRYVRHQIEANPRT